MKTRHIKSIFTFCILNFTLSIYSTAQPFIIEWQKTYGGSSVEFNDYMGNTIAKTPDGGYVFTAMTYSNDGDVSGNHGAVDCWVVKTNATGILQWQKCIGGTGDDYGKNIIVTSNGGILVGGQTTSNDGNISGNHGAGDIFVVKLNNAGSIEWEKTLGSDKDDNCFSFIQDNQGNYLIAGFTNGNNGDVSGNHGKYDTWVVKLNPSGNIIWQKCYGGNRDDAYNHTTGIMQSAEGGYMLYTYTTSVDGQVTGFHPGPSNWVGDAWLVKLDVNGNITWQNCFGGAAFDAFENIMQTSTGDYIASGFNVPESSKDAALSYGGFDWWICKISQTGNVIWSRHYGGTSHEAIHNQVFELVNGDLIAPSGTRSNDFDCIGGTISATNPTDLWILKLDASGNILGSQIFNKTGYQNLSAALINPDGSLVVSAMTDSANFTGIGFNVDNTSASQIWLLKLQMNPADTFAISTQSLSQTLLCPNNNATALSMSFSTRGTFNAGNIFIAQLSDAFSNFSNPVSIGSLNATSSGTIVCSIPAGLPQGNYYAVRIVSSSPSVTGISTGKFFAIQCSPPTPVSISNVTASGATFLWSDCSNSNKNQIKYRASNTSNWNSINTNNTSVTVNTLQPSTTYYWSVKTKCLDNPLTWSDWSETQSFTTASLRISSFTTNLALSVAIFPNPLSNSITISFSLSQSQNISLEIFDVNGRLIKTLADKFFEAGEHHIDLNAEKINAGIYFLKMQAGEFLKTEKLIITK